MATTLDDDALVAEVHEAMARYNAATRERAAWEGECEPVFVRLTALKQREEAARADLLEAMLALNLTTHGDTDFDVDVRTADRGSYDYQKLPAWVREVRGVCEVQVAVNREAVNRLVQRGKLTAEDAAAAWQSKPIKPYLAIKPRVEG